MLPGGSTEASELASSLRADRLRARLISTATQVVSSSSRRLQVCLCLEQVEMTLSMPASSVLSGRQAPTSTLGGVVRTSWRACRGPPSVEIGTFVRKSDTVTHGKATLLPTARRSLHGKLPSLQSIMSRDDAVQPAWRGTTQNTSSVRVSPAKREGSAVPFQCAARFEPNVLSWSDSHA